MTQTSYSPCPAVAAAVEAHDIHMATCRARRQNLICSRCAELVIRVVRALEAS